MTNRQCGQCVRPGHAYKQVCVYRNDTPLRAIQTLTSCTCRTSFGVIWGLVLRPGTILFQVQVRCRIENERLGLLGGRQSQL